LNLLWPKSSNAATCALNVASWTTGCCARQSRDQLGVEGMFEQLHSSPAICTQIRPREWCEPRVVRVLRLAVRHRLGTSEEARAREDWEPGSMRADRSRQSLQPEGPEYEQYRLKSLVCIGSTHGCLGRAANRSLLIVCLQPRSAESLTDRKQHCQCQDVKILSHSC
jgi:hypothetical protein